MNAWATYVAGTWLMGECEVNDVEVQEADGTTTIYKDQGLLVKRCRFLEESGCASVCVNSCKIPTQNFFIEDMGLPLTMTPDYETYECQFNFGVMPSEQGELDSKNTPCLSRCPSAGGMRAFHNTNNGRNGSIAPSTTITNGSSSSSPASDSATLDGNLNGETTEPGSTAIDLSTTKNGSRCQLMDS